MTPAAPWKDASALLSGGARPGESAPRECAACAARSESLRCSADISEMAICAILVEVRPAAPVASPGTRPAAASLCASAADARRAAAAAILLGDDPSNLLTAPTPIE